jgi:hypothetical protein
MGKAFFLFFTFFIQSNCYGQFTPIPVKSRPWTKKEIEKNKRNQGCVYTKKYSSIQRLQFFPFNKAVQIKLVSFAQPDSVIMGGELPMKNGNVDYTKLKEIKTINKSEIDTLTDILFNESYRGRFSSVSESGCYNPRNAILFVDAKGKTFAFIEICFECLGHRLSSNKIKAGDFCSQKYEYLRNFFSRNGIVFGVKKESTYEE